MADDAIYSACIYLSRSKSKEIPAPTHPPSDYFLVVLRDGLAALVISPTRELSLQIFEVLRLFAKHHQLSAGLITGGKKEFREEQASVIRMNILVATPGRLLQHLEQTPGFDASLLQVTYGFYSVFSRSRNGGKCLEWLVTCTRFVLSVQLGSVATGDTRGL